MNPFGGSNIPVGRIEFFDIIVTRYLCSSCGYLEDWIDSPEDMDKIRRKYIGIVDPMEYPTECLSCGAIIPSGISACPKCGWSYDTEQSQG